MSQATMTTITFLLWLLVMVATLGAETVESSLNPEQEKFLEQFRSAAQSKDAHRLRGPV